MIIEELRVNLPGEDVTPSIQLEHAREDEGEQQEFASRTAGAPATKAAAVAIEIAEAHRDHEAAGRVDSNL
jgi:hypothetical protein